MKKLKLPKEFNMDAIIKAYADWLPKEYEDDYYSMKNMLYQNADYSVIFGEKSNGKSYQVIQLAFVLWWYYRKQTGIVRRLDDNLKPRYAKKIFSNLEYNELIIKETKGEYKGFIDWLTNHQYDSVIYVSREWYVAKKLDDGTYETNPDVFASAFALTKVDNYSSTSYPLIQLILHDDFIAIDNFYLPNEFVDYSILLSTIIRKRTNVKVFMCGNSNNRYCPYFIEMGLKHVKDMKQGTIDLYTYGDSDLRVAVEYCRTTKAINKQSNKYFAFDNPKLKMITSGDWKINNYPHLPVKYRDKECLYKCYIVFNDEILQLNVILVDKDIFLYIHPKTTEIQENNTQLVFTQEYSHKYNYRRKFTHNTKIEDLILKCIAQDKVFYSDNNTGDTFDNYLKWCNTI